ncbi:MAG: hypothetical protein U0T56_01180 [Ferruginibacter sp.]
MIRPGFKRLDEMLYWYSLDGKYPSKPAGQPLILITAPEQFLEHFYVFMRQGLIPDIGRF